MRPRSQETFLSVVLNISYSLTLTKYEPRPSTSPYQRTQLCLVWSKPENWWSSNGLSKLVRVDLAKSTRCNTKPTPNHLPWRSSEWTWWLRRICWARSRSITSTEKCRRCRDWTQQTPWNSLITGLRIWTHQNSKPNCSIPLNTPIFSRAIVSKSKNMI